MQLPTFPERADPVQTWARLRPSHPALIDPARGLRFDYAALDRLGDEWAAALHAHGVVPGDRVAVLAGNRTEVIALLLACGRIGAALVPLNWRLTTPELTALVADCRPRILFVERTMGDPGQAAAAGCEATRVAFVDDGPQGIDGAAPAPLPSHARVLPDPDTPLLVLYTSGTTGRPKGAILPHRQLFFNALATAQGWDVGPDDIAPVSTPLFHTGGWNVFATPLWFVGGTVVLFEGFDPERYLDALATERCTLAFTVPTQLLALADHPSWGRPLPELRHFISGGAPCPAQLGARVRDAGHALKEGYGLTECGPNCFTISLDEAQRNPGAVGRPLPFLAIRIVDASGTDVASGQEGELLLRGPQLFGGYLGDPARTADTFTGDGWLRTGDVAACDAAGLVRIRGRIKEMYISGGENVYPAEVEAALATCPGVAEAVVVGIPDPYWGEVGHAFIVAVPGTAPDAAVLLAHAGERLARYKLPKQVTFLEAMPRLGSGKPDRAALTAVATGG